MVAALTPVTATGTLMQTASLPAIGEIVAQLSSTISNGASPIYGEDPITQSLDSNGNFSLALVANDDSDVVPSGTWWTFTVALVGQAPWTFSAIISKAYAPSIDLFTIPQITDLPSKNNWVSRIYPLSTRLKVTPTAGQGAVGLDVVLDEGGLPGKYATTIGDGTSTYFTVPHGLGSQDLTYTLYDLTQATPQAIIPHAFDPVSDNAVAIQLTPAPAANSVRVVIVG